MILRNAIAETCRQIDLQLEAEQVEQDIEQEVYVLQRKRRNQETETSK